MLLFWILALGVGCSSTPEVVEEDALGRETAMQGSDSRVFADQESDIMEGYGNVTWLDDERVSDSLIDDRVSGSLIIVDDEGFARGARQDASNAEIVIEKAHIVFEDIYFDFDRRTPQKRMLARLTTQAKWLRTHADAEVLIAGHCDTRGSREYNMVLGEKRAQWIKTFFMKSGVNGDRMAFISYGKEQPNCLNETEACHSKNRRAHIVLQ
jgi:peptidoglycan-associated lipoprotein